MNLFNYKHSPNHQWDIDPNAKLLNIVFQGGTFGNFLKFFLDKFSKLTPDITKNPFTPTGTSHNTKEIKFSNLIQRYHPSFVNQNQNETNLPLCVIMPNTEKDFLYLKTSQWFRAADLKKVPDDLWQNKISFLEEHFRESLNSIKSLYHISKDYIPKFIIRDWYKLEFSERLEDTFNYRWFDIFKKLPFFKKQKTYFLPLESFFSFNLFITNLKLLDSYFNLELDFKRISEMEDIFAEPYNLDQYRQQANLVFEIIQNLSSNENITIPKLDVCHEAFICAYIEKTYPFVTTPLSNYFFKDTQEIRDFVGSYPEHYKVMNPILPKFNGKDNPFYLWNLKNKG